MTRPRALGYARVSTMEQLKGLGLEIQEAAIKACAQREGLRLVGQPYRDEGISGANGLDTRHGLKAAFAALGAGDADCLVVYRLDRLARDLILQETWVERLREQGTPVVSATEVVDCDTDDPTRVLIRQVLGAISQYDRAVIRGRMESGLEAKRAAGGFCGGRPPYGFRAENRELVVNPDEQKVIALARTLSKQGKSLRQIIAVFDAQDIKPREGTWRPTSISRLLTDR